MIRALCFWLLLLALLLCGCGTTGSAPSGRDSTGQWIFEDTVTVGRVVPLTGTLASFGAGTPYVEQKAIDAVNRMGGVVLDGRRCRLELRCADSGSDNLRAGEAAQKLISDGAQIMIVSNTADTVIPVSAVCERAGIACVSVDAPASAWRMGGPYRNSWHAFFDNEREMLCFLDCWERIENNRRIGLVTANDSEGVEITTFIHSFADAKGYTIVDAGRYALGQTDYSELLAAFSAADCDILLGVMNTADFFCFWRQCMAGDYRPKMCTMAKSCLFSNDIERLGVLADGLITEVWWTAGFPGISSIDGTSSEELARDYLREFSPEFTIAPPTVGYKYANVEILYDILRRAGSLNPERINTAAAETDLETVVGHVAFDRDHVSVMSCVAGQWVADAQGGFRQEIVGNYLMPDVPVTADIRIIAGARRMEEEK